MSRSRLLGASSLRRKLKRMPEEIKKPVQKTLERGANRVFQDAIINIPERTGALAAALHKQRSSDGLSWRVGYWRKGNIRKYRRAGFRAHFTEFGTRTSTAQPFLGPAFRSNEDWVNRQIRAAVNRALRKASLL